MAERVDEVPYSSTGSGPRYPWDEWFDGSVWELVQGKDFDCQTRSLHGVAKSAARARRISVSVHIRGDRVYVQAQR